MYIHTYEPTNAHHNTLAHTRIQTISQSSPVSPWVSRCFSITCAHHQTLIIKHSCMSVLCAWYVLTGIKQNIIIAKKHLSSNEPKIWFLRFGFWGSGFIFTTLLPSTRRAVRQFSQLLQSCKSYFRLHRK
jgi:hypothetical protein